MLIFIKSLSLQLFKRVQITLTGSQLKHCEPVAAKVCDKIICCE